MSSGWQRSGLRVGDEVRIPSTLFMAPTEVSRLNRVYIGETACGILVQCFFNAGAVSQITGDVPQSTYRIMINWASIWCGHIKVYTDDSQLIVARRVPGSPTAYEVMRA